MRLLLLDRSSSWFPERRPAHPGSPACRAPAPAGKRARKRSTPPPAGEERSRFTRAATQPARAAGVDARAPSLRAALHALRRRLERARVLERGDQALLPRRAAHEQLVVLRVALVVDVLLAAQLADVPAQRAR